MPTAQEVIGTTLPPGSVIFKRWEDQLLRNLLDSPPGDGADAHPLWALVGVLRGVGTDIDGILAMVGFSAAQGPLFASCEIEYDRPLRLEVEYGVTGRIRGLESKVGRRTGPFELFTFELDLIELGERAGRVTFVWVLPTRSDNGR